MTDMPMARYCGEVEDRAKLLEQMLKDLIDAVNQFYGPDGLGKVVEQMKSANRARENRAEIDALEDMLTKVR